MNSTMNMDPGYFKIDELWLGIVYEFTTGE